MSDELKRLDMEREQAATRPDKLDGMFGVEGDVHSKIVDFFQQLTTEYVKNEALDKFTPEQIADAVLKGFSEIDEAWIKERVVSAVTFLRK